MPPPQEDPIQEDAILSYILHHDDDSIQEDDAIQYDDAVQEDDAVH